MSKRCSKEWHKKLSKGKKGKKGHVSWCKGKYLSEVTKEKMSEAHKGKKHSQATKEKMSEAHRGRIFSRMHKDRLSETHKGKKRSKETKEKISETLKGRKHPELNGENHPNWKGGRIKDGNGYILIYSPNHPYILSRKYILEHRLVMEKYLKRYLTKKEVVHHINGIKGDNRIENLKLFKNDLKHRRFHKNCKRLMKNILKKDFKVVNEKEVTRNEGC